MECVVATMESKALWKAAVMAADVSAEEREALLTWDEDAIWLWTE